MLTGEEAAARLGWSASKISRIETRRTAVTAADLRKLLDLYQVAGSLRDRLTELGRTAGRRGWWEPYADTLGSGYSSFLALEAEAESESSYAQAIVPGLLQTEAYAEEIIRCGLLAPPPGEIARRVRVRMTRQQLLAKSDDPLELAVVLDESVLRHQVGGPAVMKEQLSRLAEMADRPNIAFQVLPFSRGAHIAMTGAFRLLRFPGAVAASYVVYLENMTGELFVEDEAEAFEYYQAFERLCDIALQAGDSVDLVAQIASQIKIA
jgi:transcriptional regulator with XRE-family HTH domain